MAYSGKNIEGNVIATLFRAYGYMFCLVFGIREGKKMGENWGIFHKTSDYAPSNDTYFYFPFWKCTKKGLKQCFWTKNTFLLAKKRSCRRDPPSLYGKVWIIFPDFSTYPLCDFLWGIKEAHLISYIKYTKFKDAESTLLMFCWDFDVNA